MNHFQIVLAAIVLYIAATSLIGWRLLHRDKTGTPPRDLALWLSLGGLLLHSWLLYDDIFSQPGLNLAFFNALALTSWMVIVLFLVSSLTKPVENLGILLLPVAALTLLLEASFPSPNFMRQEVGWDIKIHVLLSMLAYSLLTLASVQSILLAIQDHHLHARQPAGFLRTLPPLQTMESLLFEMIGAGFALLTLALVSGFAFLEDMLAQHLVHKTVLSTLAWLVFGALLIGRFRYGPERLRDPHPCLLRQQGGVGTYPPALVSREVFGIQLKAKVSSAQPRLGNSGSSAGPGQSRDENGLGKRWPWSRGLTTDHAIAHPRSQGAGRDQQEWQ